MFRVIYKHALKIYINRTHILAYITIFQRPLILGFWVFPKYQ